MATSTYYYLVYIKINKTDILGNDISLFIRDAINVKLKYTDIFPIEFEIVNITEFPTHYLCQIKFQGYGDINTLASSSDNNTLNYRTSLALQFNPVIIPLFNTSSSPIPWDTTPANGNDNGWMNNGTGIFTFANTPNTKLSFTGSLFASSPSNTSFRAVLYNITTAQTIISSDPISITAGGTGSCYFSGSFSSSINGDDICLRLNHLGNYTTQQITVQSGSFKLSFNSNTQFLTPNVGISGSGDILLITTAGLSSDNPLYCNYIDFPLNSKHTLLPPDVFIPTIEFNNILSGSGTRSTVNQYNYELKRNTYPRYKGSRSTSDGFNTSSISITNQIQSSSNIYLNPTTDNIAPASNYDTTIFEFDGGNNSYPEIPNLSRLDITQILNVDTTESVDVISPQDPSFSDIIKRKLYKGINPNINQYNSKVYIPNSTKIISNDISPVSVYVIPSYPQDFSSGTSSLPNDKFNGFLNTSSFYQIVDYGEGDDFRSGSIFYTERTNEIGSIFSWPLWITGSALPGPNPKTSDEKISSMVTWSNGTILKKVPYDINFFQVSLLNEINLYQNANYVVYNDDNQIISQGYISNVDISRSIAEEMNKGVRWFITLYDRILETPININNIKPLLNTFTASGDADKYPLDKNSAYEIQSIYTTPTSPPICVFEPKIRYLPSHPNKNINPTYNTSGATALYGGYGNLGLIIWKSDPNSNTLILNNQTSNQLNAGNIIPPNPTPIITNNLTYITKTFGNKK